MNTIISDDPNQKAETPQRQFVEFLDTLISFGFGLGGDNQTAESEHLHQIILEHVRQLMPFDALAFYAVDPESFDFIPTHCEPDEKLSLVQEAVDKAIAENTFAWTLQQNRPVVVHNDQFPGSVIFHPFSTRTRTLGMFVGLTDDPKIRETNIGVRMLSVMLSQGAYAIENATLTRSVTLQNARLELEVRERTQDLQVALHAAEESVRAKSSFLANMSHEVRTPMNGIVGMCELLGTSELDEDQKECVKTIRDCGDQLVRLISDILDYSKVESGKLSLESRTFDLVACMADVCRLERAAVHSKPVSVELVIHSGVPKFCTSDELRLRQILLNLIGNAIKFTKEGSVTLDASVPTTPPTLPLPQPGMMWIELDVIDTGIGIPEDKINKLFRPFTQVDSSTTRHFGGTGLGLAICKSLAELMGGSIRLESSYGKGTTFHVLLPIIPMQAEASVIDESETKTQVIKNLGETHPLRILVVEDNPVNQRVIARMLKQQGYSADITNNGVEALEKVHGQFYDLVLCDLQMPEMDGFETTAKLLEKYGSSPRPLIVALTANAMAEDREACLKAGMDDYLSKPVKGTDLQAVLSKCPRKPVP